MTSIKHQICKRERLRSRRRSGRREGAWGGAEGVREEQKGVREEQGNEARNGGRERDTEKVSDRQISLFRTLPESKNLMQIRNGRSRGWEGEIIFHKNISNIMDMAGISTVIQKKNLQTSSYYQVLYILIRNIYPMTMCCVYIDLS